MNGLIRIVLVAGIGTLSLATGAELPFAAQVAVENYESYKSEIARKAREAVAAKREKTIVALEAEAAEQARSSKADAAAEILKVVEGLRAEAAAERGAAALADRRWVPLFEEGDLPASWVMPAEPDGGWSYKGGILEMQSLRKYATVLHEAPGGDLVVRAKMKLEPEGAAGKEMQAGIGFIAGEENMLAAVVQGPGGLLLAFGKAGGGEPLLRMEKNSACQNKFSDVQIARVGKKFLIFARGKLVHDCDTETARVSSGIALLANNSKGFFRDVEYRVPDREDLARLIGGRALH